MASSSFVTNNHPYHDTSSSCSSTEMFEEKDILLNNQSSPSLPEKKHPIYRLQRSRNNLSAKRSRDKRRINDLVLETKLTQLTNENEILRAKIEMLRRKFGQEDQELFQSDIDSATEPFSQNKSSKPIKLRFKLLNITSDL